MATPSTVQELDGITLILNDHRNVEELFTEYQSASDSQEKLRLVAKMIEELTTHAAIEEQVLYPLIAGRLEGGEDLKSHAVEEHQEAREVLAELERLPVTDSSFDDKVGALVSEVRHHVEEEEHELLPQLREALTANELADLGGRLREAKASAPVSPSQEQQPGGDAGAQGTKDELYQRAQDLDIEGRSQMSKDELAKAIRKRT